MSGQRNALDVVDGLWQLLARQEGLARRGQLRRLGVSDKHVQRQIEAGRWQLVAPEVVAADNGRLDSAQLRWRAVLHAPTGWVAGRTALTVHGMEGVGRDTVHLLVPRSARPRALSGVILHVSDRLDVREWTRVGELPATTVARAAVDGAAWSPHPRIAAGLVLDVLRQRLTSAAAIDAELAGAGRIRHKVAIRAALAGALDGAESLAEVDVAPILHSAGIHEFRRQARAGTRRHDIEATLADGTILVIEVDGPAHDATERRWADSARDLASAVDGKITVRIPAYSVRFESAAVVRQLRRIARAAAERAR